MTASSTVRAFLAVHVDARIHAALARLRDELATISSEVRWVRNEGLHATVKFLGRTPLAQLDAIRTTLAPIGEQHAPATAHVAGIGVFPNWRRPRVVWVGLQADTLAALAAAVDAAVKPFGFEPEARPFQPHITLGRVKGTHGWPPVEAALRTHADDDFGTCAISELVAYRSDLRSDGAVYTKLWSILLDNSRRGVPPWH